ncbi:MAG: hypothetical protein IPN76_07870 [Saprospiraceae bacterium]|nr:hypothetical protein [Saprospiraceae bacterium]
MVEDHPCACVTHTVTHPHDAAVAFGDDNLSLWESGVYRDEYRVLGWTWEPYKR